MPVSATQTVKLLDSRPSGTKSSRASVWKQSMRSPAITQGKGGTGTKERWPVRITQQPVHPPTHPPTHPPILIHLYASTYPSNCPVIRAYARPPAMYPHVRRVRPPLGPSDPMPRRPGPRYKMASVGTRPLQTTNAGTSNANYREARLVRT